MNQVIYSPTVLENQINPSKSVFISNERITDESGFWGLFEGKLKAKREANASTADTGGTVSSGGGTGNFWNILGGVLGLGSGIVSILPDLGVGSKSRLAETQANTALYNSQFAAQEEAKKQNEQLYLIGGGILFLVLIVVVASRR